MLRRSGMKASLAVMLATGAVGAEGLLVLFGAGCGDVSVGITLACFFARLLVSLEGK